MLKYIENKTPGQIPIINEKGNIIGHYKTDKSIPIIKNKIIKLIEDNPGTIDINLKWHLPGHNPQDLKQSLDELIKDKLILEDTAKNGATTLYRNEDKK